MPNQIFPMVNKCPTAAEHICLAYFADSACWFLCLLGNTRLPTSGILWSVWLAKLEIICKGKIEEEEKASSGFAAGGNLNLQS